MRRPPSVHPMHGRWRGSHPGCCGARCGRRNGGRRIASPLPAVIRVRVQNRHRDGFTPMRRPPSVHPMHRHWRWVPSRMLWCAVWPANGGRRIASPLPAVIRVRVQNRHRDGFTPMRRPPPRTGCHGRWRGYHPGCCGARCGRRRRATHCVAPTRRNPGSCAEQTPGRIHANASPSTPHPMHGRWRGSHPGCCGARCGRRTAGDASRRPYPPYYEVRVQIEGLSRYTVTGPRRLSLTSNVQRLTSNVQRPTSNV